MTTVSKFIPIPRLESLRSKILLFAVLATLLPAGITLWISYAQNRAALESKISQALVSASAQTSREMGVWLKERLYDLRVFASSYEVSDRLAGSIRAAGDSPTRGRLHDYLGSLHERFPDFDELLVIDLNGRVVATSANATSQVRLPDGWQRTLRSESQLIGDVFWDEKTRRGKLLVAVPVQSRGGAVTGAFAAELNLAPIQQVLQTFVSDTSTHIYMVDSDGRVIASSEIPALTADMKLGPATLTRLGRNENRAISYVSMRGREVIGTSRRVPGLTWAVIAQTSVEAAFEEVRRFRNLALLVVVGLLLLTAAAAYHLGRIIVRPLDRLTKGAAEVAAGDLAVDLPAAGGGEVGYLTTVFNDMVARLRESRHELDATNETLRQQNEELEKLSLTDGLTGLSNRRELVQRLNEEVVRIRRTKKPLSVLMADVDNFKKYNDTFGHPEGDEVLKKVAHILRESAREMDCVARYGGEEFCIMLPETSIDGAMQTAERIRARVEAAEFPGRRITISLGAATLPDDGDTPDEVISAADDALYQAKREGRNKVVQAKARKSRRKTTVG